jgi:Na+-transporting methylmalonyl-CoA/oxaloacetate decarboxylase gamma subunit
MGQNPHNKSFNKKRRIQGSGRTNMEITEKYDNYPIKIVIISNSVSFLIYSFGLIIMNRLGWISSVMYLIYILILEYRLIGKHCISCYYWGKTCGFGKGRISSLFFRRGDASKFCNNKITWKDMIPDLLVSLVPLITGIVLMIINFDFVLLFGTILIILLSTIGNGFVRSTLTCKYCKQREKGCPADRLFAKEI